MSLALVVFPKGLRDWTGAREVELPAANVRQLMAALEGRFPGFAERIEGQAAIAIDGDIVSDPMLEPLRPDSEVHFLPRIGGGR